MDFKNALEYLQGLTSYENLSKLYYNSENLDLERVRNALEELEIDYKNLKFIHVAGSKGKGTTSRLLAKYLQKSGFKVGLYTSPHLFDIRERISVNGRSISEMTFARCTALLKKYTVKDGLNLTYFEILTILAIKFFVDRKVDFAVLEAGIGGRLDATNIVDPLVAVLTRIESEHLELLGGSLECIIDEKLGIVKKNVPLVVGCQSASVKSLINQKLAADFVSCDAFFVENFGKIFSKGFVDSVLIDDALRENAKLVYLTLIVLFKKVNSKLFFAVLKDFEIPGHFEVKQYKGVTVVFDVAHTVSSIKNLLNNSKRSFPGRKLVFLIALMKDKDKSGILKLVSKVASNVVFTHVHDLRGESPGILVNLMKNIGFKNAFGLLDPILAYDKARSLLKENEILVVAGSHFLVGKIAKLKN